MCMGLFSTYTHKWGGWVTAVDKASGLPKCLSWSVLWLNIGRSSCCSTCVRLLDIVTGYAGNLSFTLSCYSEPSLWWTRELVHLGYRSLHANDKLLSVSLCVLCPCFFLFSVIFLASIFWHSLYVLWPHQAPCRGETDKAESFTFL